MCTVSIIKLRHTPGRTATPAAAGVGGYRIVVNRDEHRDRALATPPHWRPIPGSSARAIYPVDPAGGGTWVALASTGMALCLLNLNPLPRPKLPDPRTLTSRGRIIPGLIGLPSIAAAIDSLRAMDLRAFAPFRLLAIDPPHPDPARPISAVEAAWDLRDLHVRPLGDAPFCLVSSGLGDPLVEPRLELFREMVAASAAPTPEDQDRFHRHTWPARPEISVMMSRYEARTVSIFTAEVRPSASPEDRDAAIHVCYEPVPEHATAFPLPAHAPHAGLHAG